MAQAKSTGKCWVIVGPRPVNNSKSTQGLYLPPLTTQIPDMLIPFETARRLVKSIASILISTALYTQAAHAQDTTRVNFSEREAAVSMAQRLQEKEGIAIADTLALLKQAELLPRVVQAVKPPKTKGVRNWDTYRSRFVEPIRIRKGMAFWNENLETLKQAEAKYNIPQEVIVAIIGVETIYGEHIGNYRVLDSLATLAFAYPEGQKDRSGFFLSELESFIALCNKTHLDALEVKGSYAGAIGLGQFMPSSWTAYAVDGDADGIVDLFHSRKDAIFSVANFLKVHGWESGKATRVLVDIEHADNLAELLAPDIVPTFTAAAMQQKGLKLNGETLPDEKLALIELVRGEGESAYVVGGQNFFVVTRYNRSSFYANAVLELSEALKLRRDMLN
ncbi:membrane-bound lytic murein transglycosylase B [Limnobacter thiooxidans]|uniref:lytic murein transglycosylase B n=1 Tax=Limnobacter TaxID=131079 RepID=UPI00102DF733|nr:lytic murein transglycosylase B [Limnobacter sp.]MCZ8014692.1 lytic murein transglycosylase B [Limnobacter sp.]RZS40675.1 membrane-bound lytic murein transglycosylase B [Limnobacter thiooxidans]